MNKKYFFTILTLGFFAAFDPAAGVQNGSKEDCCSDTCNGYFSMKSSKNGKCFKLCQTSSEICVPASNYSPVYDVARILARHGIPPE